MKTGIDADWQATAFDYDDVDRVTRGTDATGNQRDYRYDPNGNPAEQSLVVIYNEMPKQLDSTSASFDLSDRKTATTDAGGNVTAYTYGDSGNVVKITNPDNYTVPLLAKAMAQVQAWGAKEMRTKQRLWTDVMVLLSITLSQIRITFQKKK